MPKRFVFALLIVFASMIMPVLMMPGIVRSQNAGKDAGAASSPSGVPASRLAHLRRGINLSHWFSQSPGNDYSENYLRTHTTERDIALIKSLGFDHVRFTVNPAPLTDKSDPALLNPEYLSHLDRALDMILASGLSVVVDLHPSDEFKIKLRTDDRAVMAFADFWRSLARHLARRDPERVFLEILNEPMVEDPYRWIGIQARVAAAIREGAPRHTIIATGPRWSAVDQLLLLEPLADRNVIYNFHFYEPHTFTHQGATWGADYWPYIKNIPYPSSPEIIAALPTVEQQSAQGALKAYGEERWNAERIERTISLAADWGRKHNVPLTCNEFGVFRNFSPPASRLRWIEDVRTALERHGIGWAMWDYAGSFGVATKKDGSATPDPQTVAALGLRAPK
jgi:hypothetical protein